MASSSSASRRISSSIAPGPTNSRSDRARSSARIANASANTSRSSVGRKGGEGGSYDDWTKDQLEKRAREIGIEGRSSMSKKELIDALRNH